VTCRPVVTTLGVALVVVGLLGAGAVPTAVASTADQELAKTGVLVQSDFPSGWTSSTRGQTSDSALDAAAGKVSACAPFRAFSTANNRNPRAKSPNFDHVQSNVTNSVSVYPSAAKAKAAMHTFSDPRMADCLDALYRAVFAQQLRHTSSIADQIASVDTSIAPVSGVRIGDQAVAYQGTVEVKLKNGTSEAIGLGLVSARVGQAVAGYSWTSDTDISTTLQPAIVQSVARLQHSQSAD
jgi:type II secretory pathway pseudopilin PulG